VSTVEAGRRTIVLLGPCLQALSGVSTHVGLLLESTLKTAFELVHFEVGSEGRDERLLERAGRLLWSPLHLLFVVRRRRAAIVHVNTGLTARAFWRDLIYMLVARLAGASIVYQVHGGPLPGEFCGRWRLGRAFVRSTLLLPAVIVVLSARERDAFDRFVRATPVLEIAHGVDDSRYGARTDRMFRAAAPLRLVFLGRIVRDKGVFELIAAIETVVRDGIPVELTVAGGGIDENEARARAARARLPVLFLGPVRGVDKVTVLSSSDVLVLPSYAEGLPYALLEAMAAGAPAIASRVGAIPEIIEHGVNGLLIEPRDARAIADEIKRLATNRALLERLRAASRATVAARYSVNRLAADFARLYGSRGASSAAV
jgi:glycosyltransferase involved in cell wall biosynthesis